MEILMNYILSFCLVLVFSIQVQARPIQLTLEKALAAAVQNSPLAAAINQTTAENFAEPLDKTHLENPQASFIYRADKSSEIELEQPFRLSDITLSRFSYKKTLQHLHGLEQQLDLLRLSHTVSDIYYQLYAQEQELTFLKKQFTYAQQMQKMLQNEVVSNTSSSEKLIFNTETLLLNAQIKPLEKSIQRLRTSFQQQLNLKEMPTQLSTPPIISSVPINKLLEYAHSLPNQQKILSLQLQEAKQQRQLIEQDRFLPTLSPRIGYGTRSFDKADDWNVGVSLSIPLWNRQSGAYSAAKAAEKTAQARLSSFENISFETLVRETHTVLIENTQQLKFYQNEALPTLQKATKQLESTFQGGAVTPFDLLQAREKELTAKRQYLNLLQQTNTVKNELEMLIGARLEDL